MQSVTVRVYMSVRKVKKLNSWRYVGKITENPTIEEVDIGTTAQTPSTKQQFWAEDIQMKLTSFSRNTNMDDMA